MKHWPKNIFFLFIFFIAGTAMAQSGSKIIEESVVKSTILNHPVKYAVYLPAGYAQSAQTYPVVYLLHGYTGDQTAWLTSGGIKDYADKAIADGIIPSLIIIMPDADSTWYINSYDGKEKYEDFFIGEFMPAVEKTYRIKAEKEYRGIAGLSMGGYGTLIYALKHPELFAAAAPLSAAVWDDAAMVLMPDESWDGSQAQLFGRGLKGKDRLTKAWYDNSVLKIVETKTADELKGVRYWIDCGDDDFLARGNSLLHIALLEKQVPHEYRVRDGAHTWAYWRTGITPALQFIGESFGQK